MNKKEHRNCDNVCDQHCKCGHKLCEHMTSADPHDKQYCLWCDCKDYNFDQKRELKEDDEE